MERADVRRLLEDKISLELLSTFAADVPTFAPGILQHTQYAVYSLPSRLSLMHGRRSTLAIQERPPIHYTVHP